MLMYYMIYKITNLIDGRMYVGKHRSSLKRDGYMGSSPLLSADIKKYGKKAFKFEVLEYLPDQKSLDKREKEFITEEIIKSDKWYNKSPAIGDCYDVTSTAEFRSYRKEFMIKKWREGEFDFLHKQILSKDNPELRINWITNGKENCKIKFSEETPEGWWKGRSHLHNNSSKAKLTQWIWVTNGKENLRLFKTDLIPIGYTRGRTGVQGFITGKKIYNDGRIQKAFKPGFQPINWQLGPIRKKDNRKYITNGIENKKINSGDILPPNWFFGRSVCFRGKFNPNYGKIWINDGKKERMVGKETIIPEGWRRGCLHARHS